MKRILMCLLFIAVGISCAQLAQAQTEAENIANMPAIMKSDCRNNMGKPMESRCDSDASYQACLAYLKAGKWNYCLRLGVADSQARRATPVESRTQLLKENCKQIASGRYSCPNEDFNLSLAYNHCVAFQNGTGGVTCVERTFLKEYADRIEAKLKNKPVGYAFVIMNKDGIRETRAWGAARKSPDVNPAAMTVNSNYTMASVSKNITATAVLMVLRDRNISIEAKAADYLPWNWKPGANFNGITIRELLTHTSGIRCTSTVEYAALKQCVANGINLPDKKAVNRNSQVGANGCYNNSNYALFRVMIPVMLGKLPKPQMTTFTDAQTDQENEPYVANVYADYVNKNIFAKAGVTAYCRPLAGNNQPLSYKLSAPNGNGGDFGDMSLLCGSQGRVLSAQNLANYFSKLNNSEAILSYALTQKMRDELIGYTGTGAVDTPFGKSYRWWHNGFHPASQNPGEINTLVQRFSNGIQLTFIMNSDLPAGMNYGVAVTDAFYETMQLEK